MTPASSLSFLSSLELFSKEDHAISTDFPPANIQLAKTLETAYGTTLKPAPRDLPEDILRAILEVSAKELSGSAGSLTLVSKEVQKWIDFLLFKRIVIRHDQRRRAKSLCEMFSSPTSAISSRISRNLQRTEVLSINTAVQAEPLNHLIALCPSLRCLSVPFIQQTPLGASKCCLALHSLTGSLTHLRCDMIGLPTSSALLRAVFLARQPFVHLTYLDVTSPMPAWLNWNWSGISNCLPNLQYLLLNAKRRRCSPSDIVVDMKHPLTWNILPHLPALKVLIVHMSLSNFTGYALDLADMVEGRLDSRVLLGTYDQIFDGAAIFPGRWVMCIQKVEHETYGMEKNSVFDAGMKLLKEREAFYGRSTSL